MAAPRAAVRLNIVNDERIACLMSRKEVLSNDPVEWLARQGALAAFGLAALQGDDLDVLLKVACEQVAAGLDVPMSKIATVVPGADTLLLKEAVGIPRTIAEPGRTSVPGGAGSAIGYALEARKPVLSTVATETRFEPSRVVLDSGVRSSANVVIWDGDEPFGVLEVDLPEPDVFNEHDLNFLQSYANLLGAAVTRLRLSKRATALAQERELIIGESIHRVKNILSVVQALASRTRLEINSLDEYYEAFTRRLSALSRLQNLSLVKGEQAVPLHELARSELEASGAKEGQDFILNGPPLLCPATSAQALGLLIHELTTNACKHGALSERAAKGAQVVLNWTVARREGRSDVTVHWKERGTQIVAQPSEGFGSQLLRNGIARMLGGSTEVVFSNDGVDCVTRFTQPD